MPFRLKKKKKKSNAGVSRSCTVVVVCDQDEIKASDERKSTDQSCLVAVIGFKNTGVCDEGNWHDLQTSTRQSKGDQASCTAQPRLCVSDPISNLEFIKHRKKRQ